jgi:hypothetical protein
LWTVFFNCSLQANIYIYADILIYFVISQKYAFKYYPLNKNTLYSLKASEDIFTTTQIVGFGGLQTK